jgi:hypothetical protein
MSNIGRTAARLLVDERHLTLAGCRTTWPKELCSRWREIAEISGMSNSVQHSRRDRGNVSVRQYKKEFFGWLSGLPPQGGPNFCLQVQIMHPSRHKNAWIVSAAVRRELFRMAAPCTKSDSIPPVCAVHGVPLVWQLIPIDSNYPALGSINCLVCPSSGSVLIEVRRRK